MKLDWTLLRWRIIERAERIQMRFVWILPRWIVRWALIRAHVHAMQENPSEEIPAMTVVRVAQAWDRRAA